MKYAFKRGNLVIPFKNVVAVLPQDRITNGDGEGGVVILIDRDDRSLSKYEMLCTHSMSDEAISKTKDDITRFVSQYYNYLEN